MAARAATARRPPETAVDLAPLVTGAAEVVAADDADAAAEDEGVLAEGAPAAALLTVERSVGNIKGAVVSMLMEPSLEMTSGFMAMNARL